MRKKLLGAEHPAILTSMALNVKTLDAEHPGTLTNMNDLPGTKRKHEVEKEADEDKDGEYA